MAKRSMCAVLIEQSGEYESYREAIVRVFADAGEAGAEAERRNALAVKFGERWTRHNECDPESDNPDFDALYEAFSKRGARIETQRARQLGSTDFDGRFAVVPAPFMPTGEGGKDG